MKKISIVIPTYNEEENVENICKAVCTEMENNLKKYDYELILIDNFSTDNTRFLIRKICSNNKKIKAIFNSKNFGQFNSPYYAICQSEGDCTIMMSADFQDPIDMISKMILEWEKGYKIICPIKTTSKENKIMRFLRNCYYKAIKKMSDISIIEHFTGFGLYDKDFVKILKNLKDSTPFLRGIVAELGFKIKEMPYEQKKRAGGKSHNNFATLYDGAMLSVTSYTKVGLRIATIIGFIFSFLFLLVALIYLILKLVFWNNFVAGTIPTLLLICFLGALQLFFIGLLGEYVLSINLRLMNRPLVIEEERINFTTN